MNFSRAGKFTGSVLLLTALLLLGLQPLQVLADGMIVRPDPQDPQWQYGSEENQLVYINYENGRQKMLLTINAQNSSNDQVWIFPVPALPEKVVISNVTSIPSFYGTALTSKAKDYLSGVEVLSAMSQLYPLAVLPLFMYSTGPVSLTNDLNLIGTSGMYGSTKVIPPDVQVYDQIQQNGMTTELLTAKTTQGLADYFTGKGLHFDQAQLPALKPYLGQDYTLVVSWLTMPKFYNGTLTPTATPTPIPSQGITLEQQNYILPAPTIDVPPPGGMPTYLRRGIMVSFPTDRIFFPLFPTSVYGSTTVPATIYVTGLVNPQIYKDIADTSRVDYFTDGYANNADSSFMDAAKADNGNLDYTRITIQAPSKLLTQDLWIDNVTPLQPLLSKAIISLVILVILKSFIVDSILASTLASLIVFKEARSRKFWKYSLLGLTNLLTFGTFLLVLLFLPTGSIKPEDQPLMDQLKHKGYRTWSLRVIDFRKLIFAPLFTVLFLIFSIVGAEVLKALL
jgi:hypothetical protein